MNLPLGIFLFGVVFFGFMVVVGVVKARRKKEKAYYLAAMVSLVMFVVLVLVFLNEFVVAMTLMALTAILSIAGLPKLLKIQEQESTKQLQEVDLSAPLRPKDFVTWKGWFKLASRYGIRKTLCLYSLFSIGVGGATLFILSTFYRFITVGYVVGCVVCYTVTVSILVTFQFYRPLKKALERNSLELIE